MTKQEVRLNNFRAQYNSILGNIRVVNLELEGLLLKRSNLEVQTKDLNSELRQKHEYLVDLTQASSDTVLMVNKKMRNLEVERLSFEQEVEVKLKSIGVANKKLHIEKDGLMTQSLRLKDLVSQLTQDKNLLVKALDKLQETYSDLLVEHGSLSQENASLSSESAQLEKDYLSRLGEISKEITSKTKHLHSLQAKIEAEIAKEGTAKGSVEDREKDLTRRERDFDILVNRLRILYNEVKPGISLKI